MPDQTPVGTDTATPAVGQIWAWRGQEEPATRYRIEFVGTESVAIRPVHDPSERCTCTTRRVRLARLAAEYRFVEAAAPIRGRRPGKIPRGTCEGCGRDVALRKSGDPFAHRRIAGNGYSRLGYCNGGQR